ncbi:regulatory protein P-II for glutamine synthetase [uncultured Paludibacter sp.]|nr:regulatory protein P-II for glutamine synthetase [uncultured Paludibacter sp.]
MKKIEAIIRKSCFDEVLEALHEVGIDFFTYWDVTGVGNEKSGAIYRATVYETRLIERRTISFVCREKFVDAAIEAIVKAARTGEMGDGKIFISTIDESVRIRTGEKGPESLYIKE